MTRTALATQCFRTGTHTSRAASVCMEIDYLSYYTMHLRPEHLWACFKQAYLILALIQMLLDVAYLVSCY